VKKVLRSLPQRFDLKFFAIEEAKDLNTFSMDQMHSSLTDYEMRIGNSKPSNR